MAPEHICNYHKYGHCKFSETCRKFHSKENCENDECETFKCLKRHPRSCRYFEEFRRCKFGEFCSFAHKIKEKNDIPNEVTVDLEARIEVLENKVKDKDSEIDDLRKKVNEIEEQNEASKIEFTKTLEKVTTIVLKEATEALVKIFNQKQDDLEKRSNASFDNLSQQLSMISSLLLPSGHVHEQQQQQDPPAVPRNQATALSPSQSSQKHPSHSQNHQCELCGKSFGSHRALTNHARNDHEPNIR